MTNGYKPKGTIAYMMMVVCLNLAGVTGQIVMNVSSRGAERRKMGTTMNRHTFEGLVKENIEWLLKNTEHSLERDHILGILKASPDQYYGKESPTPTEPEGECEHCGGTGQIIDGESHRTCMDCGGYGKK